MSSLSCYVLVRLLVRNHYDILLKRRRYTLFFLALRPNHRMIAYCFAGFRIGKSQDMVSRQSHRVSTHRGTFRPLEADISNRPNRGFLTAFTLVASRPGR